MQQLIDSKIPNFPALRNITINDMNTIEEYVSDFPPYSDFNFMSLLAWNTEDCIFISKLFGNLVIQFDDYISRKTYFSFLGINKPIETCKILIKEAKRKKIANSLKLIPETSVKLKELNNIFTIIEDRDNFDYVFDIKEMVDLKGKHIRSKKNFINRFQKKYEYNYEIINLDNPHLTESIFELIQKWKCNKGKEVLSMKYEFFAIKRAIKYAQKLNTMIVGLFINNNLIGISVNNLLPNNYAMNLFEKADLDYVGSYPFLRHITCKYLLDKKITLLNFESDIGIEGLRQSKSSYHPKFFLKKYVIKENKF